MFSRPPSSPQQHKRRGAVRRPGAARRPSTATTPTGLGRQKQLYSAAAVRRARKHSTDGAKVVSPGANPFHRASSRQQQHTHQIPGLASSMTSSYVGMTSLLSSQALGGSGNPFLAQLAKKDKPAPTTAFGENFTSHQLPPVHPQPPPSYAAAVKGPGSVPSFITHGPSSIPLGQQQQQPYEGEHWDFRNSSENYTYLQSVGQQSIVEPGSFGHTHQSTSHTQQPTGHTYQSTGHTQQPTGHTYQSTGHTHQPTDHTYQSTGHTQQPTDEQSQKTLHLKNLPEHVNNPHILRKHFSQFGEITVLDCQPGKRYATVGFITREAAARAKKSGRFLCEEPIQIFWNSRPPQKPRPDPGVPIPIQPLSRSHDPRLTQSRVERVPNEQGRGGNNRELPSMLQAGRKRPADVAGLETAGGNERGGGGGGELGGKKSIWKRLGGREGAEGNEQGATKVSKGKSRVRQIKDEDWTPEGGEQEEEEEDGDEGVVEGGSSVLQQRQTASKETAEDMDTIARSVAHPYYLRSLHKPETVAGIRGPKAVLEVPQAPTDGGPPHAVGMARMYAPIPRPHLPPPPMPQGQSSADLYQSLNTRDEQIRKSSVRQTSLTTAEVVVGTCPDMCPEKERYMREDRRRLSWFELNLQTSEPGAPKVDHQRAVKEYNRSAADKAEDLSHELRPEPILLMTMDYLVTRVMDEREGRTEMWYDFVWNRTRAIRKDITLQHLCSRGCVELTEKCARFHILCAYLLCEEEINVFDQKMNHENLTKCLITLKQFYRDLRTEQDVYCDNEAEFCCYDILLHLQDGNVLNIVEQYSPTIRQSNSVRFAVDIALAFSSNNYAKFFKLVRSLICSYLYACILHRYFSEIRTSALHVMTRAYTHTKPTSFPLAKFTELLGFENEVAATEFCTHFDLTLTKKMVKFVREFTHHSPSSLPILLAPALVCAKRVNRRLGEIVNGGPLPLPPKLPCPCDSFAPGTPLAPPTPTHPAPPVYSEQDLMVAINLVLEEIIRDQLLSVAMEMLWNEHDEAVKQETLSAFCESVTSECVREECTSVATTTLKNAQYDWQIRENALILEEVAKVISMEMEIGIVIEQASQVVMQIFRECQEELVSMAICVCDDIMCECVRSEAGDVCVEAVKEAELARRKKLERLEKLVLAKRRKRYWKKWCRLFKARQHARDCVSAIPSLPPLLPLAAQPVARRQLPGETVISECSLEIGEERVAEFLEAERCGLEERRKQLMSPLDLPSLLSHSLLVTRPPSLPPLPPSHHTSPHMYWSLALLHSVEHSKLPHSHTGDLDLLGYLEQKLKFCPPGAKSAGQNQPVSGVREISVSAIPLTEAGGTGQLKIAVKSVRIGCYGNNRHGNSSHGNSRQVFCGVCALMLLAPTPRSHQTPESYRDDVIEDVMSLSENSQWVESPVPMLVLAPFHVEERYLAHWIMLRISLQSLPQGPAAFLSDVTFDTLQVTTQIHEEKVCKGLKWLADHAPPQPPLSCVSVRDFLEQGVQKYFIPLVRQDAEIRKENGLPSQSPGHLVSLYNSVVAHLVSSAASDSLSHFSWPLPEFAPRHFSSPLAPHVFNNEGLPRLDWNGDLYRNELRERISHYQLVPFHVAPPTTASWAEQYKQCFLYLEEYVGASHALLLPRIKALLRGYMSHVTFDQSEALFPWDHVIITCIDHMVSIAPSDLWVTCFHGNTKEFATPTSWLMAEAATSLEWVKSLNSDPQTPRAKRHRRNMSDSYLFDHHHLSTLTSSHPTHLPRLPLATKLAEKIGTEKQLSIDFEEQLKKVLSEGESIPTFTPLLLPPSPPRHDDHAPQEWAGSLEAGLQLLKMKIRTSRFQERTDRRKLQMLTATP